MCVGSEGSSRTGPPWALGGRVPLSGRAALGAPQGSRRLGTLPDGVQRGTSVAAGSPLLRGMGCARPLEVHGGGPPEARLQQRAGKTPQGVSRAKPQSYTLGGSKDHKFFIKQTAEALCVLGAVGRGAPRAQASQGMGWGSRPAWAGSPQSSEPPYAGHVGWARRQRGVVSAPLLVTLQLCHALQAQAPLIPEMGRHDLP